MQYVDDTTLCTPLYKNRMNLHVAEEHYRFSHGSKERFSLRFLDEVVLQITEIKFVQNIFVLMSKSQIRQSTLRHGRQDPGL